MSALSTLKRQVERAIGPAARRLTRSRARILMYHRPDARVLTPDANAALFERQVAYLAANFTVRPLQTVVARLQAGEPLEPNTVVVTVDDGYHDFLEYSYPVLQRYEVPATIYIVSEFAGGQSWLWFDALRWLTLNAPAGSAQLSLGGVHAPVRLHSIGERYAAWGALAAVCGAMRPAQRDETLSNLQAQLGVSLPARPTGEYSAMGWDQIRGLDAALVEVGAHTRTHTILTNCPRDVQRAEIAGSKQEIEANTGRKIVSFCYPNGMREDFSAETVELVRDSGYTSAVLAYGGLTNLAADVFRLQRLPAPADFPQFLNCVNGLWSLKPESA